VRRLGRFARWTLLFAAGLGPLASIHCSKSRPSNVSTAPGSAPEGDAPVTAEEDAGAPMEPREVEAWAQADGGEAPELIRLVNLVGCADLRERAASTALRATAIRAMAYCPDFSELPWLAEVAASGRGDDPVLALDVVVEQAARPRRAVDPEDADELHTGCAALLSLARTATAPKERRVLAIRALRMLAERGCVKVADIPKDLDAK
jgi:hypothetical protein